METKRFAFMRNGLRVFGGVSKFVLYILLALPYGGTVFAAEETFDIDLWPGGVVYYKFDDGSLGPEAVDPVVDQPKIETEMGRWETALTIVDPGTGASRQYIDFRPCAGDCPDSHLVIRYNTLAEDDRENECNNMCEPVGMNPGGITQLNLRRGTCPRDATLDRPSEPIAPGTRTNQDPNTIRHELGHCLGLWHEFNRADADRWLVEQPDLDVNCDQPGVDGECFPEAFGTKAALMPPLGNYDYDSLMHYSKFNNVNVTDQKENSFGRQNLDRGPTPAYISARDKSRLLQYYAWKRNQNWGFFKSLSYKPQHDPDALPNPYLAEGVEAVGTPAIAYQSPGNYDIFAHGSDNRLYWKMYRMVNNIPFSFVGWRSIGCCFGSDPSAISRGEGQIDIVAVGAASGKLIHKHYENGEWGSAVYVQGGYPTGGIKQAAEGRHIGPAVASRGADSLDVFVVRSDGRLAFTTLNNGVWTKWLTLGDGYNVTARPAAIALSTTQVRLAINESDDNLYEPLLRSDALPFFSLGTVKATTAYQTPPALTKRDDQTHPYRVLITNADGRISHRFADDTIWRDIGGIPKPGTGPSAVAAGRFSAYIVMTGEDAKGCTAGCARDRDSGDIDPDLVPNPNEVIQPGGLWLRHFE